MDRSDGSVDRDVRGVRRLEQSGITGADEMHAGESHHGVIEFHPHATNDKHLRASLVVTMQDGKITAMQGYRRRSTARKAAHVTASVYGERVSADSAIRAGRDRQPDSDSEEGLRTTTGSPPGNRGPNAPSAAAVPANCPGSPAQVGTT